MAEVSDVVAAVDVGGTRIKAALVTAAYDTIAAVTTPTPDTVADDEACPATAAGTTSPRTMARFCSANL